MIDTIILRIPLAICKNLCLEMDNTQIHSLNLEIYFWSHYLKKNSKDSFSHKIPKYSMYKNTDQLTNGNKF